MTIAESSFKSHSEYLPILFNLNIAENKREDFIKSIINPYLLEFFNKNEIKLNNNISSIK